MVAVCWHFFHLFIYGRLLRVLLEVIFIWSICKLWFGHLKLTLKFEYDPVGDYWDILLFFIWSICKLWFGHLSSTFNFLLDPISGCWDYNPAGWMAGWESCGTHAELEMKILRSYEKIPIAPMGVLAPGSAHARPSAQPPHRLCREILDKGFLGHSPCLSSHSTELRD